jgi:integrase
MLRTGLRVSDALQFNPKRLVKGETGMWIYPFYMQKSKRAEKPKLWEIYVPDDLKQKIEKCYWLSKERPFLSGGPEKIHYLATEVRERMKTIGKLAGVDDCRPHRCRDTFAIRLLLKGVSLEEVSRLLCHSSIRITEKFYAKWIVDRKNRLERIVYESMMDPSSNSIGDK